MPRPKKQTNPNNSQITTSSEPFIPEPPVRESSHEALLKTILSMSDALVEPLCTNRLKPLEITYATPINSQYPTPQNDEFADFKKVVSQISELRNQNEHLSEQMSLLAEVLGIGNAFPFLFRNLFAIQPPKPQLKPDGKPLLTERECEVLSHVAGDHSHEEIAKELNIAISTVNTTLRNIYRKLGVHRPMQAAAVAATRGYLQWDNMTWQIAFARGHTRGNNELIEDFCMNVCYFTPEGENFDFDFLAEFGLLLMAVSGAARRQLNGDRLSKPLLRGVIYEVSKNGKASKSFGEDWIGGARSIVVAPEIASKQGFTVGNLFVAHDLKPQQNLNRGAISEFTPDGEYVRTFCGSSELSTRIIGNLALAFDYDGRLLETSGTWTDAVLAFSEGGDKVERFVDGNYFHITLGKSGDLYGVQCWGGSGLLRRFNKQGESFASFGQQTTGKRYYSITVNSKDQIFIGADNDSRRVLQEFDSEGHFVQEFIIHGYNGSQIAMDEEDHLYLPCSLSNELKIVSSQGEIISCLSLPKNIVANSVAVNSEGRIWVCGIYNEVV